LLTEKFEKCALIEVDEIRKLIVRGESDPFTEEGQAQLMLSAKNTIQLARNFYETGFTVIIDDCITDEARFTYYVKSLHGIPFATVLLLPDKEMIIQRDDKRLGRARLGIEKITWLHERFSKRVQDEKR
jgi:hypothetical protein